MIATPTVQMVGQLPEIEILNLSFLVFFQIITRNEMYSSQKKSTNQQPEVPRNVEYGSLLRSDSSEIEVKSLLEGL